MCFYLGIKRPVTNFKIYEINHYAQSIYVHHFEYVYKTSRDQ